MPVIDLDSGSLTDETVDIPQSASPQLESVEPASGVINLDTGQFESAQVDPAQELAAQEEDFFGASVIEPAAAIGSGLLASSATGLKNLFDVATGQQEVGEAVEDIKSAQGAGTFVPRTEAGKEGLKTVGDFIKAGVDFANVEISALGGLMELISGQGLDQAKKTTLEVQEKGVSQTAGDRAFEITGDPLISTVAAMSPEILGSLIPITKVSQKRSGLRQKLADQIKAGETDNKLANYMLSGSGRLKGDPVAKESIKQGFDQGVISAIKAASPEDRAQMLRMVQVRQKGLLNERFAVDNRASDIAGDSLLDRLKHIKRVNRKAGKELDVQANALRGQQVDFDEPISNFLDNLDQMGIKLDNRLRPNFKGSDIEGLKGPQQAIANIVKRLSSGKRGVAPDAYELHRAKKFIDENVSYGKTATGLGGKTEGILKQLRRDLDTALDNNFPKYNEVNTTYADTVGAIDALQDVAGRKMDLFGPNADKAVGTLLRRLMSNAQSRIPLADAVKSLDDVSKKYGASFNDDIRTQMLFVDELDTVIGTSARTSLAGETAKSIKSAGQKTAAGIALEAVAAGAEKVRGINRENALKSITELLKRK